MLITLSRSGGITGISLKKTINTKTLSPEKAKKIEDLVSSANFFTASSAASPHTNQPDRFTYTVSIEHDTLSRTLSIDEKSLNSQMKELIEYIEKNIK